MRAIVLSLSMLSPCLAHGMDEETQRLMVEATAKDYIWLGAEHMLTGYDHLLFLFGVMFFLSKPKEILQFITAFTLGHSITLISATLAGITANYYLVDAVIALSVMYKGFENLGGFQKCLDMESPNLLKMVFLFGLVHGFGLSTRLQQLPISEDLVPKMLAFNVGVELGQIGALLVILGLLQFWDRESKGFKRFSIISNAGLVFVGFLLLLMQLHSYQHTQYPDDFGFPVHEHQHIHEDMDQQQNHHDSL